jgi:hypothetical protein
MFLLNQNNRNNWSEWFKMPYDLAMAGACIGSKSTYYKCLNELQDWELIKYIKGKNDAKAPMICILQLSNSEPLTVPLSEPLTVQPTVPLSGNLSEQLSVLLTGNIDILITSNYKLITDNIYKWVNAELKKEKPKRFIPPTYQEVVNYCIERNNKVDPQRFIDHYTSNGWMVGKNKMKNWKAAIHTWEKNNFNTTANGTTGTKQPIDWEQRDRAFVERVMGSGQIDVTSEGDNDEPFTSFEDA